MEKVEILKKFLNTGLQLDYESLDFFSQNPQKIEPFFNKIASTVKPTIISLNYVLSILEEEKSDIDVIKEPKISKKTLTIDDVTKILNYRYSFLKKILTSRLDLINPISLNKINPKSKHFSTIIIVKEKIDDERAIMAEDETGEAKFFFNKEEDYNQIVMDDVIGAVCDYDERIKVNNLMWPDIQMKRTINKTETDVHIAIVSGDYDEKIREDIIKKNEKVKHILFVNSKGNIIFSNKSKIDMISPAVVKIEKNIILLITNTSFLGKYKEFEKNQELFLISLLKRRNLNSTFEFKDGVFENDPYLIESIPDIFVVIGTKLNSSNNYKGTTIITASDIDKDRKIWIINLKTRETINLALE